MVTRTQPTLKMIFCEFMINSKVIFKRILVQMAHAMKIFRHEWVNLRKLLTILSTYLAIVFQRKNVLIKKTHTLKKSELLDWIDDYHLFTHINIHTAIHECLLQA